MSKLEELKQMVAELFEQATDTTTIQKSAVVGAKIDEIAKEEQELVDKHAELLKEYRQAVIHSSFKPDGHTPDPTPLNFEPRNIPFMSTTLLVSHPLMSPLNLE